MGKISEILEPIASTLLSINNNLENNCYDVIIGIPPTWVFSDNDDVVCEITNQNNNGKIIKISPKNEHIGVDDLIQFVCLIITTNQMIVDKEREFTEKMENLKKSVESETEKFKTELSKIRESSFKTLNESLKENSVSSNKKQKKDVLTINTID